MVTGIISFKNIGVINDVNPEPIPAINLDIMNIQ